MIFFSNRFHLILFLKIDAPPFPTIKSTNSLVAKHVTPEKWAKLAGLKTKTSGFTIGQVSEKYLLLNVEDQRDKKCFCHQTTSRFYMI